MYADTIYIVIGGRRTGTPHGDGSALLCGGQARGGSGQGIDIPGGQVSDGFAGNDLPGGGVVLFDQRYAVFDDLDFIQHDPPAGTDFHIEFVHLPGQDFNPGGALGLIADEGRFDVVCSRVYVREVVIAFRVRFRTRDEHAVSIERHRGKFDGFSGIFIRDFTG